ncbi:MAG TPA: DMT family transporter [Hyphomicrobiaceae bacterium]|nr:DMT family transporter [Hyphomicrobiaceae bacterium]
MLGGAWDVRVREPKFTINAGGLMQAGNGGGQRTAGGMDWLTNNGALLLILTTLFWGANAVAGKFAVGHISPFVLTAFRWLIASSILIIIARRELRRDWPAIKKNLLFLFLLGGVGFSVFNGLLYTSLKYTTALNVTILQAGMPMVIFILNFLVFQMRTHWAQALGYSITLGGVLVTAARGDWSQLADLAFNNGDLIMLGAVVIYAAYSVALRSKPVMHWLSFLTVLACSAAIMAVPLAGFEILAGTAIWPTDTTAWVIIFYTTIFPSVLAQGFFIRGNELLGGNAAGLFLNLVPIFGAILSVLLLHETFHVYHGIALAMVIGGIFIAQSLSRGK